MLARLLKAITGSKSKTDAKSKASEARNAVRGNKRMTGEKEQAAIDKINAALDAKVAEITKRKEDAKPKPKGQKPKDPAKRKQSKEERTRAATGDVSALRSGAGKKPLTIATYRSYTSTQRAGAKADAKKDYEAGNISEIERDKIIDRVDRANELEVDVAKARMDQGRRDKDAPKVSLKKPLPPLKSEMQKGGMGLKKPTADQKGLQKLPTAVRNKMGYMKRGGMMKSGNNDMRKGGMFYK